MPRYLLPQTLDDVISALAADSQAVPLAGGTDLMNDIRLGRLAPTTVVDLAGLTGLADISGSPVGDGPSILPGGGVRLGAMVTMRAALHHPLLRHGRLAALRDAMRLLGGAQMQAVATIGGNLCHASPAAETGTPLLVHGAVVHLDGPAGPRQLPLSELWSGPGRTTLASGELMTGVVVPAGQSRWHSAYRRLQLRRSVDIAVVGASAALAVGDGGGQVGGTRRIEAAAIALSAVGPTMIRVPEAEAVLAGAPLALSENGELQPDLAEAIAAAGECCRRAARAISDIRASADYRTAMTELVATRAITAAARRADVARVGAG